MRWVVRRATRARARSFPSVSSRPVSSQSRGPVGEFIQRGGEWWRLADRSRRGRDRRITFGARPGAGRLGCGYAGGNAPAGEPSRIGLAQFRGRVGPTRTGRRNRRHPVGGSTATCGRFTGRGRDAQRQDGRAERCANSAVARYRGATATKSGDGPARQRHGSRTSGTEHAGVTGRAGPGTTNSTRGPAAGHAGPADAGSSRTGRNAKRHGREVPKAGAPASTAGRTGATRKAGGSAGRPVLRDRRTTPGRAEVPERQQYRDGSSTGTPAVRARQQHRNIGSNDSNPTTWTRAARQPAAAATRRPGTGGAAPSTYRTGPARRPRQRLRAGAMRHRGGPDRISGRMEKKLGSGEERRCEAMTRRSEARQQSEWGRSSGRQWRHRR